MRHHDSHDLMLERVLSNQLSLHGHMLLTLGASAAFAVWGVMLVAVLL